MLADRQKNFYDDKRYFQGKDNPTDAHPEAKAKEPMPRGQIVFGLLFLAFVGLLAFLNIRSAREEVQIATPAAAAPVQATH